MICFIIIITIDVQIHVVLSYHNTTLSKKKFVQIPVCRGLFINFFPEIPANRIVWKQLLTSLRSRRGCPTPKHSDARKPTDKHLRWKSIITTYDLPGALYWCLQNIFSSPSVNFRRIIRLYVTPCSSSSSYIIGVLLTGL